MSCTAKACPTSFYKISSCNIELGHHHKLKDSYCIKLNLSLSKVIKRFPIETASSSEWSNRANWGIRQCCGLRWSRKPRICWRCAFKTINRSDKQSTCYWRSSWVICTSCLENASIVARLWNLDPKWSSEDWQHLKHIRETLKKKSQIVLNIKGIFLFFLHI